MISILEQKMEGRTFIDRTFSKLKNGEITLREYEYVRSFITLGVIVR